MKRFANIFLALTIAIVTILTGCEAVEKPAASTTGTIEFRVTDAPAKDEVTAVIITVSKIQVHRALAEREQEQQNTPSPSPDPSPSPSPSPTQEQERQQTEQGEGEWLTIEIPGGSKDFDLLTIEGIEEFLASGVLEPGKYTQVRLIVEEAKVGLGGAEPKPATVPSGELKLVHPFDIIAGETTVVVIDFDADKSVNVTGNENIMVKPVVKLITK